MEILVNVGGLALDAVTGMPVVILLNEKGDRQLLIWIGSLEAVAIVEGMDEGLKQTTRPMTHDLFKLSLDAVGAKITKVTISDLKDNTYFASINLMSKDGKVFNIDARPSDAINLALRFGCPIYAEEKLLSNADKELAVTEPPEEEEFTETDLEKMDPTKMYKA